MADYPNPSATLDDFDRWLGEINGNGRDIHYIDWTGPIDPADTIERKAKVRFFTDVNEYTIVARQKAPNGYLGCTATSRKFRAGEDWRRGNDLPDGPLNYQTWQRILAGIVAYEMVKLYPTKRADLPEAHAARRAAGIHVADEAVERASELASPVPPEGVDREAWDKAMLAERVEMAARARGPGCDGLDAGVPTDNLAEDTFAREAPDSA